MSKKTFKKFSILLVILLISGLVLAACGTTDVDDPDPDPDDNGEPVRDTLTASMSTHLGSMDPSFVNTPADYYAIRLWNDSLVFVDEESQPDLKRSLATSWNVNEEGTIWTFELRKGVKFHDGKEMTSRDVKFTYDRLRDPAIGATTVGLYSNIVDITTPDDYTVVFELAENNPTFLIDLNPHQSMVLDADNPDFSTNYNGVGPFMVDEYIPEDRITFVRNPNYWRSDDQGKALPYLERVEFLIVPDATNRVEAMRSGQTQFTAGIPGEFIATLEQDPNIEVLYGPSNTHHVIRMHTGLAPFNDVRVRQALKAGTNRLEIAEIGYEGLALVGKDTPVGPAYGDLYIGGPELGRDIEKAKQLLADAGYADGLDLTLLCVEDSPISTIAVIWQEQMKAIGVNVDVQLTSNEDYYSQWLDIGLGITSWGSRANPYHYFNLAYVTGAQWNETHFSDPELDSLAEALAKELDEAERIRLYHAMQEIMIERGPVIIGGFVQNTYAIHKDLKGVKPHMELEAIDFTEFHFVK